MKHYNLFLAIALLGTPILTRGQTAIPGIIQAERKVRIDRPILFRMAGHLLGIPKFSAWYRKPRTTR